MSLIPDEQKEVIKGQLAQRLLNPVRLIVFVEELGCQFCPETKQLILELAALNDKIKAEVHDFEADSELAKGFGVDKVPAVVIMNEKDYGIRYYGLPYGYEFQTLLNGLAAVSQGKTGLSEDTKAKLHEIKTPVNIKVFVTLTCPHCPVAASLAHQFAMENDLVRAEVIDGNEFLEFAKKYTVMGVPKIVINDKVEFVGAVPENMFLQQVLLAVQ
jgi:glutaredoxin-like protein